MEFIYSKQALKFLDKLDKTSRTRIILAINTLPFGDVKKLKGIPGYRLRVGNFRVIFDKNGHILTIIEINNRGQIY